MGEKRAGPWAVIWRSIFATPFILTGLGSIGSGISSASFGPIVFGVLFTGAGAFVVW
jgi:hypothetical protein